MNGLNEKNFQAAHLIGKSVFNSKSGFFADLEAAGWPFDVNSPDNGMMLPKDAATQSDLYNKGYPPVYSAIHMGLGEGHRKIDSFVETELGKIQKTFDSKIAGGTPPAEAALEARAKIEGLQHHIRNGLSSENWEDLFLFNNKGDPLLKNPNPPDPNKPLPEKTIDGGISKLQKDYHDHSYKIGSNGELIVDDKPVKRPTDMWSSDKLKALAGTNALIGGAVIYGDLMYASIVLEDEIKEKYGDNSIKNTIKYMATTGFDFDAEFMMQFAESLAIGVIQDSIMTMMGLGLLVHARDFYELSGDLHDTVKGLASVTDNETIHALNETVTNVVSTVDGLFKSKKIEPGIDPTPTYVKLANVFKDNFDKDLQTKVVTAILNYLEALPSSEYEYKDSLLFHNEFHYLRAIPDIVDAIRLLELTIGNDVEEVGQAIQNSILRDDSFNNEHSEIMRLLAKGSDACFLGHTPISMWGGGEKRIDQIEVGDWVVSYDAKGTLVPGKVTRTFVKQAQHVLDLHGLMVTPGHVMLCGDGRFSGRHVPIIDILRSDGALVTKSGKLMRAATGAEVGSHDDRFVLVVTVARGSDGVMQIAESKRLRLGTRHILSNGKEVSISGMIGASGGVVTDSELVRDKDGVEKPLIWPFGALPRPEDYVLSRSNLPLCDIYAAGEWDDIPPMMPAPAEMGERQSADFSLNLPLSLAPQQVKPGHSRHGSGTAQAHKRRRAFRRTLN